MDLARMTCSAQGSMYTHGPTQLSHPAPQTNSLNLDLDLDLSLPCNHPLQHFFDKLLFLCSQNDTFCNVYSRGIKKFHGFDRTSSGFSQRRQREGTGRRNEKSTSACVPPQSGRKPASAGCHHFQKNFGNFYTSGRFPLCI